MLPSLKTSAIAAVTALSLAVSTAAPAHAWGKNEQNFLKGVAAAVIVGSIIKNSQAHAQPAPAPVYQAPAYQPAPQHPHRGHGRVVGSTQNSIYATPAAQAFNSYGSRERKAIQSQLRAYGYYSGGIDGSFGPGTYRAVVAYARDTGGERQLGDRGGAYGVYDSLIY